MRSTATVKTRAPVRYANTADGLEIAYQVLGDGPIDVVIVPGMTSNVDRNADYPVYGGYLRRFPRFGRTIVLDRRGAGISDREVVGSELEFDDRGERELRGIEGRWRLLAVRPERSLETAGVKR